MTTAGLDTLLKQWPDVQMVPDTKDLTITVPLDQLKAVLTFLKEDGQTRMDFLRMIAAVDYPEYIELVYQLFSYPLRHSMAIKAHVPKTHAVAPSMISIWPAANWHEREAFDLLGVQFEGHPNMTRLLLPDDWEGHPLRKDYQQKDHYQGVSTTRTYATTLPSFNDPMAEGDS